MRAWVERISHTGYRIVNENHLQRFLCRSEHSESFHRLLASRTSFTVAINGGTEFVDDAIAVGEHLYVLRHRFRRVRSTLYQLAFETLRRDEEKITIGRRWRQRRARRSLLDHTRLLPNKSLRRLRDGYACDHHPHRQHYEYFFHLRHSFQSGFKPAFPIYLTKRIAWANPSTPMNTSAFTRSW